MENISSEEELLKLRNEGKISEVEYQDLLAAIRKLPVESINSAVKARGPAVLQEVPWQIWVVVALLALEVVGNLLIIRQPLALIWLGAKCIFILGLLKRWRWIFCLFVVIGVIHVLFFLLHSTLVSLINLIAVVFALCAFRFYFPNRTENNDLLDATSKPSVDTSKNTSSQIPEAASKHRFGKIAFVLMLVGIVMPFVCYQMADADARAHDANMRAGVTIWLFLGVTFEITAFVMGVISWPDIFGKATVITISVSVITVLALLFLA